MPVDYNNMSVEELMQKKQQLESTLNAPDYSKMSVEELQAKKQELEGKPKKGADTAKQRAIDTVLSFKGIGSSIIAGNVPFVADVAVGTIGKSLPPEKRELLRQSFKETEQMYRDAGVPGEAGQSIESVGSLAPTMLPLNTAKTILPALGTYLATKGEGEKDIPLARKVMDTGQGLAMAAPVLLLSKGAVKGRELGQDPAFREGMKQSREAGIPTSLGKASGGDLALKEREMVGRGGRTNMEAQGKAATERAQAEYNKILDEMSMHQGDFLHTGSEKIFKNFTNQDMAYVPIQQPLLKNSDVRQINNLTGQLKSVDASGRTVKTNVQDIIDDVNNPTLDFMSLHTKRQEFDNRINSLVESKAVSKEKAGAIASKVRSIVEKRLTEQADRLGFGTEYKAMKATYKQEQSYNKMLESIGADRGQVPDFVTPEGIINPVPLTDKLIKWRKSVTDEQGKVLPQYKDSIPQRTVDRVVNLQKGMKKFADSINLYLQPSAKTGELRGDIFSFALNLPLKARNKVLSYIYTSPKMARAVELLGTGKFKTPKEITDYAVRLLSYAAGDQASE